MNEEHNKNQLDDYYIIKDGRKLSYGYTTGSCATAAAKAAALILLEGNEQEEKQKKISFMTPKGIGLSLSAFILEKSRERVVCSIIKHAGDDPDATDGIEVLAIVSKIEENRIIIDGGLGVGRVTKKGLEQPVGNAAINKVPRQMITNELLKVKKDFAYTGGFEVIIEVPKGEEIAKKTFNPKLGIEGGISILGTSGIVVPMSEEALIKSIGVEMKMRMENGNGYLLITPGNYGEAYLKEHMNLDFSQNVKCSNFVGQTLDMAVNMGAKGILFVAHIGKFIKVSGGIMNTHSKEADCRMELLAAHAIQTGASIETVKGILNALTTEEALEILKEAGMLEKTMNRMMDRILYYLKQRCKNQLEIGVVVFSNVQGYLGKTGIGEEVF